MRSISKPPEERRQKLIDAARRLFLTKGYERTAVSDIVKEVNISQGTFYYQFRSKNGILEEAAKRSIPSLIKKIHEFAERGDKDTGRGGWSCEDEFLMLRYVE